MVLTTLNCILIAFFNMLDNIILNLLYSALSLSVGRSRIEMETNKINSCQISWAGG